ncbi:MAG TPA: metallophosphoesterase family protein, partial [Ktedonobacterales bacterium]|nr:metallophosphoesterase family protein [Ktedonobacterales bacterium]
ALAEADVALLITHAAIEGLARPNEAERTVTQASLAALPAQVRLVVAGHIHRYARQRIGGRDVVVVGATERR